MNLNFVERRNQLLQLKNQGLTYQEIGDKIGISRQRVYQILFPDKYKAYWKAYQKTDKYKAYQKAYRKTDKYKAYQKHIYHLKFNKKFANCERCIYGYEKVSSLPN